MCSKSQTSTLRSNYRALLILIAASLPPAGYAQEQPITGELSQRSGYSVEEETISVLETEVLLSIDTDLADRGRRWKSSSSAPGSMPSTSDETGHAVSA